MIGISQEERVEELIYTYIQPVEEKKRSTLRLMPIIYAFVNQTNALDISISITPTNPFYSTKAKELFRPFPHK